MILDKVLGHIDTPWLLLSASVWHWLALRNLFYRRDLAEQTTEFKRRDKYLCGAIGSLVSALLIKWTWQAALVGIVDRHTAGGVDEMVEICDALYVNWSKHPFQTTLYPNPLKCSPETA